MGEKTERPWPRREDTRPTGLESEPVMRTHRLAAQIVFVALAVAAASAAGAERDWQPGVWAKPAADSVSPPGTREYVIDTDTLRLRVRDTIAPGHPSVSAPAGTAVTFAIDGTTVFVRQGATERALRLIERIKKEVYTATGGGHYVTAIDGGGLTVTLEDGSKWAVDPNRQFLTAHWKPYDEVTVSRLTLQPRMASLPATAPSEFEYFINNLDDDEGAAARFVPPGSR
jgi:endonuclease YncB( thermonuclease family)